MVMDWEPPPPDEPDAAEVAAEEPELPAPEDPDAAEAGADEAELPAADADDAAELPEAAGEVTAAGALALGELVVLAEPAGVELPQAVKASAPAARPAIRAVKRLSFMFVLLGRSRRSAGPIGDDVRFSGN
jgi:hypothetical protein